jgi:hypothetical protein
MASKRSLLVVAAFALSHVQARLAATGIEPAATTVLDTTAAGAPLLKSEKIQLTEAVIERLRKSDATAEVAHLFAFTPASDFSKRVELRCKTFPGDSQWPSDPTWSTFDSLLDGALAPTIPVAAPCYDSEWGPKDLAKCNAIVTGFSTWPTQ